jgi:Ran-binding protein 1
VLFCVELLLWLIFGNFFQRSGPEMAAVVEEKDVSGVEEKATPSVAPTAAEETAEEPGKHGDEEDTGAQIAPIVKLEEVVISTGEENEDVLLDM